MSNISIKKGGKKSIYSSVVSPHPSYEDDLEKKYFSRLLNTLILFFLIIGIPLILFNSIVNLGSIFPLNLESYITWAMIVFMVVIYLLNKSGHFRLAAVLTPTSISVTLFTISIFTITSEENLEFLLYLIVPIVLGIIFLRIIHAFVFLVLNIMGMFILPVFVPKLAFWNLLITYAGYISVVTVLVLIAVQNYRRIESIRRKKLLQAERVAKQRRQREEFLDTLLRQDLKSSSQIVLGYLQLIEDDVDLNEEHEDYLKKAIGESHEEINLIEEVNELREIEEMGEEWSSESRAVDEIIGDVIKSSKKMILERDIDILYEGRIEDEKIEKGRLSRMFLFNFVKARIYDHNCGKIRIKSKSIDGKIVVTMVDDGDVISNEEVQRIFDEEYTGETAGVGGARFYMLGRIASLSGIKIKAADRGKGFMRFDIYFMKD